MATLLVLATLMAAATDWCSRLYHLPRLELVTKPLTTVLVIALALVADADINLKAIAVVALVLCLVGDIVLMPAINRFVVGLGAFLLGHLVFIVLFLAYGLGVWWMGGFAIGVVLLLVVTVGRRIVDAAAAHDAALRAPVFAYLMVISSMGVVGWATGRWMVVVGTTLFVVSDSILGWAKFVASEAWMSVTVMITYHGAIALLALSLW